MAWCLAKHGTIVRKEWVVDSLEKKRRLPESRYTHLVCVCVFAACTHIFETTDCVVGGGEHVYDLEARFVCLHVVPNNVGIFPHCVAGTHLDATHTQRSVCNNLKKLSTTNDLLQLHSTPPNEHSAAQNAMCDLYHVSDSRRRAAILPQL